MKAVASPADFAADNKPLRDSGLRRQDRFICLDIAIELGGDDQCVIDHARRLDQFLSHGPGGVEEADPSLRRIRENCLHRSMEMYRNKGDASPTVIDGVISQATAFADFILGDPVPAHRHYPGFR